MAGKKTYDVVIIGGAIMGSSAAFWLSRLDPDLDILVVEPDPTYARSSTALSVASIRQQFTTRVNVEISRFGIEFIKNVQSWLGQGTGVDSLGFRENGYLFLSGDPQSRAVLQEACSMQRDLGAYTELLTPPEVKKRFDWLNVDDVHLASFGAKDEGWFDNMGLLGGFRKAAQSRRVRFMCDRVIAMKGEHGQVSSVSLQDAGNISAGVFINAAGTFAGGILAMLGETLPIEPRKRTVFMIDAPNAVHPDAPLMVCHSGFYLRPEHNQWICAIVPDDDKGADWDDFEPDLHLFEETLWPKLYARSPGFDAVKVISAWAGHYAYNTLDQNAVIGQHPNWRNLYLMNGFSGHGLQQAPAVGRGIAELVIHNSYQTIDMGDLGVDRILAGQPFSEKAIV
ncbi:NAD(P)/FAD-dependent oxidoreductase [Profundibacter sp.]